MSYAPVQAPAAAEPRRPVAVTSAALLLAVMAVAGLGYAVATLAVVPGVVSRFRAGASSVTAEDVDAVVALIWLGAGVAVAVAVLLCGLYLALALALRRGSRTARVLTWVVCGLGLLAGCASAVTVMAQRGSSDDFGGVAGPLNEAYPGSWIGLNIALAVGQIVGYVAVAGLLIAAPGHFFARTAAPGTPPAAPGPYGAYGALPGMPGLYETPGTASAAPTSAPGASGPPVPYGAPYGGAPATPFGSPYVPPSTPYSPADPPPAGYDPPAQQYNPPAQPYHPPAQQYNPPAQPYGPPAGPAPAPGSGQVGPPGSGQVGPRERGDSDGDDHFWARPPA